MINRHWQASYGSIPKEINPEAHRSVVSMLDAAMKRFADRPAFRCFGQMVTYVDVDKQAKAFAAYLQNRLGIKKGDRIAVMSPNLTAFPVAFLGIIRAGAVQVNVNPLYTPRELEHQLNDAGVNVIVVFSGVSATVAEVIGKTKLKTGHYGWPRGWNSDETAEPADRCSPYWRNRVRRCAARRCRASVRAGRHRSG